MSIPEPIAPPFEGVSKLTRPRFSPGLLLEDEDLNAGVTYTREMSRLLFSRLFGCGVVCGLEPTANVECRKLHITVEPGLALDCHGNPIHIPEPQPLPPLDTGCDPLPTEVWVAVCYATKCCRPRDVSCGSDDDEERVKTRSRDAFEIRLYGRYPECACGCEKPLSPSREASGEGEPKDAKARARRVAAPTYQPDGRGWAPQECPCYEDHYAGRCPDDCGCACVVIGRIGIKKGKDGDQVVDKVQCEMVRRIRPLLVGHRPCRSEGAPQGEEEQKEKAAVETEEVEEESKSQRQRSSRRRKQTAS